MDEIDEGSGEDCLYSENESMNRGGGKRRHLLNAELTLCSTYREGGQQKNDHNEAFNHSWGPRAEPPFPHDAVCFFLFIRWRNNFITPSFVVVYWSTSQHANVAPSVQLMLMEISEWIKSKGEKSTWSSESWCILWETWTCTKSNGNLSRYRCSGFINNTAITNLTLFTSCFCNLNEISCNHKSAVLIGAQCGSI